MAARRAIDFIAELRFGGPDDGAPNWGTSQPITAILRDFSVEVNCDTVDEAGLGDPTALMRFAGNARFTLRGTLLVNTNTYFMTDSSNNVIIGQYLEIAHKPDSTTTAPYLWRGIITRWELRVQRNDLQEISFEMQGPILQP